MKTALFVTDCSIDSALVLRNWLTHSVQSPLRLTLVHPYAVLPGADLHKSACAPARAAAQTRLDRWRAMLGDDSSVTTTTEILFGSVREVVRFHLVIRPYDYWLIDDRTLPEGIDPAVFLHRRGYPTRPIRIGQDLVSGRDPMQRADLFVSF